MLIYAHFLCNTYFPCDTIILSFTFLRWNSTKMIIFTSKLLSNYLIIQTYLENKRTKRKRIPTKAYEQSEYRMVGS